MQQKRVLISIIYIAFDPMTMKIILKIYLAEKIPKNLRIIL